MKPRYIPSNYQAREYKDSNAIVYFTEKDGAYYAMGYSGKKSKHDFHFKFKTESNLENYVNDYLRRLLDREVSKRERQQKKLEFIHSLKVGDILYSSWGWEQTNVDFYQVVEVKGKMVIIREVNQEMPKGEEGFMQGHVLALKDDFTNQKPLRKKVLPGNSLKINSFSWANLWDGTPRRVSWYG